MAKQGNDSLCIAKSLFICTFLPQVFISGFFIVSVPFLSFRHKALNHSVTARVNSYDLNVHVYVQSQSFTNAVVQPILQ